MKENRYDLYVLLSSFMVVIASSLLDDYYSLCNIISGVIWCRLIYHYFKTYKEFMLIMLPVVINCFSCIIPEIIFELQPTYIVEIDEVTFPTGGVSRLVFYQIILFVFSTKIFYLLWNKLPVKTSSKFDKNFTVILLSVVLLSSVYGFAIYGVPLMDSLTRYEYWDSTVQNPIVSIAHFLYGTCFLLLALLYDKYRNISLVGMFLILAFTVLSGDKYTPFQGYIVTFMTVIFLQKNIRMTRKVWGRICLMIMIFVSLTGGIIYYHYTDLINNVNVPVEDMVLGRLAQQAQIWWAVDYRMEKELSSPYIGEFSREIDTWFRDELSYWEKDQVGIYKVMNMISRDDRVSRYLFSGIRFSTAYPAVGLIYFGYFGLIFLQIIVAGIFAVWARMFYYAIMESDVILAICSMKIGAFIREAFSMGNFYGFFAWHTIAYLLVFALWIYLGKSRKGGEKSF